MIDKKFINVSRRMTCYERISTLNSPSIRPRFKIIK